MKFVVSSSALSARLQSISRVISSKNTLPILDCVLFKIEDNRLTLTASDNETTLTTSMELVECDENITFAVNARTVQDAIKEIPEQPLNLYVNTSNMEVTVEYLNGKYRFMALPADEYPTPPTLEEEAASIALPTEKLLSAITRTLFATVDDPLRPVMGGLYFDFKGAEATIVATDGRKMACSKIENLPTSQEGNFILPKKPATFLKNFLSKEQGDAVIRFSQRNAVITTESYVMNCRLIEGKYPRYESVIPQDNPNCVTVSRTAMLSTLRRVLIFSNASSSLIKLQLGMGNMTISSQDIDFSMSAEETLLCEYNGTPLSIGFNGTFLTEVLNYAEADEVVIKMADASRACIIVPATKMENEDLLMLIMPMLLGE